MRKKAVKPLADKNVFINCPFDIEYIPILQSISFALLFLGYIPRCSLEASEPGLYVRLNQIIKIISECRFGIHDISRVEHGGTTEAPLPRFNMPFECGLFFGAMRFGNGRHKSKDFLILDSQQHRFRATLSDLAGTDAACHAGNHLTAIGCLRDFFKKVDNGGTGSGINGGSFPGASTISETYIKFRNGLPVELAKKGVTEEELTTKLSYWPDFVEIANLYLSSASAFPTTQA